MLLSVFLCVKIVKRNMNVLIENELVFNCCFGKSEYYICWVVIKM